MRIWATRVVVGILVFTMIFTGLPLGGLKTVHAETVLSEEGRSSTEQNLDETENSTSEKEEIEEEQSDESESEKDDSENKGEGKENTEEGTEESTEESTEEKEEVVDEDKTNSLSENSLSENALSTLSMNALSVSENMLTKRKANAEGLLAYYKFGDLEDTDDGVEIVDESGSGNSAYIRGNGAALRIGSLELPGGNHGSDAAYIELPEGLFDGQDTLTISGWFQSNMGSGDFSAMYFGTKAGDNGFPAQYWLLNPAKNGNFKSVITDSYDENTPYNTETNCSNTKTPDGWNLYTTVITENEIIGYLNGKEIIRDTKETQISDFGSDLVSYIGKSEYPDRVFKGAVKEVKVYTRDLSKDEIWDMYQEIANENTQKKEAVYEEAVSYKKVATRKIELQEGETKELPSETTIKMEDDSTRNVAVTWKNTQTGEIVKDTADLLAGTYTLQGTLQYFSNPLIAERADPYIIYDAEEKCYYFTSSWPAYGNRDSGYDRIAIRKSDTLEGLANAEDNIVWKAHTSGEQMYHIWAPELHKINGKWYLYYAASTSDNGWGIRCFVLACEDQNAILKAESWTEKGKFTDKDGGTKGFDDMCLDMTYFEKGQKGYVIWAYKTDGISMLKLAEVDKNFPWKLASNPITLSTPEYEWERVNEKVNEGAAVLDKNNKIYVTYSASATGDEYCMGMLSIEKNKDILDLRNWVKSPIPVLETNDLSNQYGPGHNSFTVDADGNIVLVYHARDEKCHQNKCKYASSDPLYDPCRNAMLAYVRYDLDGTPIFTSTEQKEFKTLDTSDLKITCQVNEGNTEFQSIASYPLQKDTKDKDGENEGIIVGNKVSFDQGLFFEGNSGKNKENYLDLSNNKELLKRIQNSKDLTITAWVKNDASGNQKTTVFTLGKDSNNWYAFNTLNWGKGRTTFKVAGKESTGIKYDTAGNVDSSTGTWYPITIVLEDVSQDNTKATKLTYYMNGEYVLEKTTDAAMSDLGDLSFLYLGAGLDSNYYDFIGGIKEVSFFDFAFTKSNVLTYLMPGLLEQKILGENKSLDEITTDLVLPSRIGDRPLTFTSSNTSIVTNEGKVIRPPADLGDVQVTITAEYLLNGNMEEIPISIIVKAVQDETEIVASDLEALTISNLDDVRGNLFLPSVGVNGSVITWASSNKSVITEKDSGKRKAGVVTRQEDDVRVTLTATVTYGAASDTKKFTARVRAAVGKQEYSKYLFAYFTGDGGQQTEQIYYSTSKDGLRWDELNHGSPVIKSTMGEKGLRDPFIIRSPEGDKFYLIATDLRIASGNGWSQAQTAGSQSIMVWESTDCVNWSEQRMCKVAPDTAGCTWAPEAFYDEETGEYIVFWASKVSDDNYSTHQIYYVTTRDFYTFSEPEVWITLYNSKGSKLSIIDTSVIAVTDKNGKNTYYRFSKNESSTPISPGEPNGGKYTIMEKSDSLMGEWTRINSDFLLDSSNQYREGGTCFKFNNEDKWCLLLDNFGGGGYYPCITEDLSSGKFERLKDSEFSFAISSGVIRHGTVISLTDKEYNDVMNKWGTQTEEDDEDPNNIPTADGLIADFDFDDAKTGFKGAGAIAKGSVKLTSGKSNKEGDQAFDLTGDNFLTVTKKDGSSLLTGLEEITISMDAKFKKITDTNWAFFIARDANKQEYQYEKYLAVLDKNDKLLFERYNNSGSRGNNDMSVETQTTNWKNITLVVTETNSKIYIDGVLKGTKDSTYKLSDIVGTDGILQIGKGNWKDGEYAKGMVDNLKIYNKALSDDEVTALAKGTDKVLVKSIIIQADSNMVGINDTLSLTADVYPAYATDKDIQWTSTDSTVAKVSSDGVVTGVKEGEAIITATATDGSKCETSYKVKVGHPVKSIKLSAEKDQISIAEKLSIKADVTPGDADKTLLWSSSDRTVAKVDNSGLVTGIAAGKVTIKAASNDGSNVYGEITIEVTSQVEEIKLQLSKNAIGVQEEITVKTTIFPENVTTKKLKWSSSNPDVASVDENGLITGNKLGTAVIKAEATDGSGVSSQITIKVCIPATDITINADKKSLAIGEKVILKSVVAPAAASQNVIWKSENSLVATVDSTGCVTGISGGKVYIRAISEESKKVYARIELEVTDLVNSIIVTASKTMIRVDEAMQMSAKVEPNHAFNKKISWSSSNEKVAKIDQNGEVTGLTVGTTIITAMAKDGSKVKGTYLLQVIIPAEKISIITSSDSVKEREYLQLAVDILPKNSSIKMVIWESSDPSIANVDENGKVCGKKAGLVTIKATTTDGSKIHEKVLLQVTSNPQKNAEEENNKVTKNKSKSKSKAGTLSKLNVLEKWLKPDAQDSEDTKEELQIPNTEPELIIDNSELNTMSNKTKWVSVGEQLDKLIDKTKEDITQIEKTPEIVVNIEDDFMVPAEIFQKIQGKNVNLLLSMDNGMQWIILGKEIESIDFSKINMKVNIGSNQIPKDILDTLTGEKDSIEISLLHDGKFGFTAILRMDMKATNAGLYANLFYYNKNKSEMEFMDSQVIDADGMVMFQFEHASEYVVVIDKDTMEDNTFEKDENEISAATEKDTKETWIAEEENAEGRSKQTRYRYLVLFVIVIIFAITGFVFVRNKKKKS